MKITKKSTNPLDKIPNAYYTHIVNVLSYIGEFFMHEQTSTINWKEKFSKDQICTIPNFLSFFRIALIPFIIWMYAISHPYWALAIIILSSITDIADGIIARKFNMVTDFGKGLDPIADKLTQGAIMIALIFTFPFMWMPVVIMAIKEALAFTLRFIAFKHTQIVQSAKWHGKLTTVSLYIMIVAHIVFPGIPKAVSVVSISVVSALMIVSCILYTIETIRLIQKQPKA